MASNKKINRDKLIEDLMESNPTFSMEEVAAMADAQIAGDDEVKEVAEEIKAPVAEKAEATYTEAEVIALLKKVKEMEGKGKAVPANNTEDKRVDHLINFLEKQEGFHIKPMNTVPDDPDDLLESPITFFAPFQRFVIWSSSKYGRVISPPFDLPIIFTDPIRKILSGPTKGTDKWLVISYFTTYSKKQRDFVLNHEEFGVSMFAKPADALNTDAFFASVKSNVYREVIALTAGDVLARAKSMSIPITDDIETLRDSVANAIVKQRMAQDQDAQRKQVERLSDIEGMTQAKRQAAATR